MLDVMRLRNLGDNQVILRRQLDTNLAAQWASLVAQMVARNIASDFKVYILVRE